MSSLLFIPYMEVFAHTDPISGKSFKRLIVEPVKIPQTVDASGLINPEHEMQACEIGKVTAVGENSEFQIGDEVLYQKMDRSSGAHIDSISLNGKTHDVIYEQEVWSRNDEPLGRIFIEPISDLEVDDIGLIMPRSIKSITEKGIVVKAPADSCTKAGDRVEYRKQDHGIYPQVDINGKILDLLFEADIFTVNGGVAPYRMIVKIDLAMQKIKRTTSTSGLIMSPLFIHMLHNLQHAEVTQMGTQAKVKYPMLKEGDTAIIHHTIEAESQNYRILGHEMGVHGYATYEYRIINCWAEDSAEIMGKLHYNKRNNKIIHITPINNMFLEWDVTLFEAQRSSELIESDNDLTRFNDIELFKNELARKKKDAAEKAKLKSSGIRLTIQTCNPETDGQKIELLAREFAAIQKEEAAISAYLSKNHLMLCKQAFSEGNNYIVTTHEQLYPINILGKKFLIAHNRFITSQTKKNMDIKIEDLETLPGFVYVKPIPVAQEGKLIIPDAAKEKPRTGTIAVTFPESYIKVGETVTYRPHVGMEQKIGDETYLILKTDALISRVKTK